MKQNFGVPGSVTADTGSQDTGRRSDRCYSLCSTLVAANQPPTTGWAPVRRTERAIQRGRSITEN
jgi:hypothetical protein